MATSGEINDNPEDLSINQKINLDDLITDLGEELEEVSSNITFYLKEYRNLTKKTYIKDTETEYTEVWLIKEQTGAEAPNIFKTFDARINALKDDSSSKKTLEEVFENPNNIVMKQESNIVIIIISNNTLEVENKIDPKIKQIEGKGVI